MYFNSFNMQMFTLFPLIYTPRAFNNAFTIRFKG